MELEPLSEAPVCALQPLALSFLVVLAVTACLQGCWISPLFFPDRRSIPGPRALHFLLSAGCLLCLEISPSGWALASA